MAKHPIEAVVRERTTLTESEAEAIVGLAHLAISVDGDVNEEETAAFRALVGRLRSAIGVSQSPYRGAPTRPSPLTDDEHVALLDRMAAEIDHVTFEERMRSLVTQLTRPLSRQLAYRVVYALHIADFAVHRSEEAFERDLAGALRLDEDQVAGLVEDVTRALSLET